MTTTKDAICKVLLTYAEKARVATEYRNDAIRTLHEHEGMSLRAIAEVAGLSHSAIAKIVKQSFPDDI